MRRSCRRRFRAERSSFACARPGTRGVQPRMSCLARSAATMTNSNGFASFGRLIIDKPLSDRIAGHETGGFEALVRTGLRKALPAYAYSGSAAETRPGTGGGRDRGVERMALTFRPGSRISRRSLLKAAAIAPAASLAACASKGAPAVIVSRPTDIRILEVEASVRGVPLPRAVSVRRAIGRSRHAPQRRTAACGPAAARRRGDSDR